MTTPSVPVESRLNIGLDADAAAALEAEQSVSGLSRADVVNRAVQLYHAIAFEWRQGNEVHIKDPETGKTFTLTMTTKE